VRTCVITIVDEKKKEEEQDESSESGEYDSETDSEASVSN